MSAQQTAKEGANAQTVRHLFDAIKAMDVETIRAALHPDVRVNEPSSLPYGGTYEGSDAFFDDLLMTMMGGFEVTMTDEEILDAGDTVVGHMTVIFTSRRTGKALHAPYVEIYRFRDGLIADIDVYPQDTHVVSEFMRAQR